MNPICQIPCKMASSSAKMLPITAEDSTISHAWRTRQKPNERKPSYFDFSCFPFLSSAFCFWFKCLFFSSCLFSSLLSSPLLLSSSPLLFSSLLFSSLLVSSRLFSCLLFSSLPFSFFSRLLSSRLVSSSFLFSPLLSPPLLFSSILFYSLVFSSFLFSFFPVSSPFEGTCHTMVLPQNGYFWAQINHAELPFLHVLNSWRPKNQNFNISALEGPKHRDFARNPPFSRADPDVCPEPKFSRTKRPFLSTHPHKVCEGFLA